MAAMMGAEEFGMGTSSLIAMGCIMVRQCHSNTCPVGVCTQDEKLRKKFTGTPEKVVNFFTFVAMEVREILASLGFKTLNQIIGRADLLVQVSRGSQNLDDLDLNPLLIQADPGENKRYSETNFINLVPDNNVDEKIWSEIKTKIKNESDISSDANVKNTDRAIGTKLSHYIYKKFGDKLKEDLIKITLNGSAGQSLGAFLVKGLKIKLFGDSNDYVAKGLSGGKIIVIPSKENKLRTNENTIIGNTVLYGATSGKLFAAGKAGERFAVRNSGAISIVEGCDSNGCEYMTGGTVAILGSIGDNFAAGMTGGMAFVYDPYNKFENYVNSTSVMWQIPETKHWMNYLKKLLQEYNSETNSIVSKKILNDFSNEIKNFKQICPIEMLDKLENPISLKKNILQTG
jgi:glutamate synthase (NADPH/NADH) large chain